ncbi:MAG: hypothetical protein WCF84_23865, partial [Anaerolineae bacterium]
MHFAWADTNIPATTPTPTPSPTTPTSGVTKYYYFGSARVAMNVGGTVYYFHADHLGSTSVTTDSSGGVVSAQTYFAFGAVRSVDHNPAVTDYG